MILNNTTGDWLVALTAALAVAIGLYGLKSAVVRRLARLSARTSTRLDDLAAGALASAKPLVMAVLGVYAGASLLDLPPRLDLFVTRAAIAAALIQVAIWGDSGVRGWLAQYRANRGDDPARATSAAAVGFIARVVLWSLIALMILDNLGFNITTLVASLGIGGIAVALAVQNILGDLFASLSIVLDKPFVVGDFILVDAVAGTVEYVGLKTTRVRSLSGEQIVFSNTALLNSRIHNMKRMETRRIVFSISVPHGTPEPQLRAIPELIGDIVSAQPQVTFDRSHFNGFGPSSLTFETVYIVNSADYRVFMDVQQEIYLQLVAAFAERKIQFALPAQRLHVVGDERGAEQGRAPEAPVAQAKADPGEAIAA
jgi:small-conductance mechanosensitive channel